MTEPLDIAICGGGIASICLAHTLCRQSHLRVKIFEASHAIREDGAAIGLGSNAQEALELLSPSLRQALDDAGGTRMDPSVRMMMATGPDSGRHMGDIRPTIAQIVVHRGPFIRKLRNLVPDAVLEAGKKLIDIQVVNEKVHLRFEDGTSFQADALIGCDGINSITRKQVLGPGHPAAAPVYSGGYNHRVVIPLQTAKAAFGEEYCKLRTQYGWIGDGGFLLTDFSDDANSMQVIAGWSSKDPWPHEAPFVEWSKDRLRKDLEGWGQVGRAMTKIFTEQDKLYAAGSRTHLDTPTYTKGPICIAGDAAQTFSPFQGAGAGQAIEDALILSVVLSLCHKSDDIIKALDIYDTIRRPRRSDIASSSRWAGLLLTGRAPGIGLNVDRIAETLPTWADNIYGFDLAASCEHARSRMRS